MRAFVLIFLLAAATILVEAEEKAPEEAEDVDDLDADYLDGEEDYDYDEEAEDESEWPEEWGDPELDDYDYDEPHGGEL